jgi:hypothetical protein
MEETLLVLYADGSQGIVKVNSPKVGTLASSLFLDKGCTAVISLTRLHERNDGQVRDKPVRSEEVVR